MPSVNYLSSFADFPHAQYQYEGLRSGAMKLQQGDSAADFPKAKSGKRDARDEVLIEKAGRLPIEKIDIEEPKPRPPRSRSG